MKKLAAFLIGLLTSSLFGISLFHWAVDLPQIQQLQDQIRQLESQNEQLGNRIQKIEKTIKSCIRGKTEDKNWGYAWGLH